MQDWSQHYADELFAQGCQGWLDSLKRGEPIDAESIGKIVTSHLLVPNHVMAALTVAAMLSDRDRHFEAVRLAEFAMSGLSEGAFASEPAFAKQLYGSLAKSYVHSGMYRKAQAFAKKAGDDEMVKSVQETLRGLRQPLLLQFPDAGIYCAMQSLGYVHDCQEQTENRQWIVASDLDGQQAPDVLWLRSQEPLQDLTPARLGRLVTTVKSVVCSSRHLLEYFSSRIPFWATSKTRVLQEAPLVQRVDESIAQKRRAVVLFRGNNATYELFKLRLSELPEPLSVVRQDDDYSTLGYIAICKGWHDEDDITALIEAQAHGVIPFCSAVGSLPEYCMSGRLIKPPYCAEHVSAFVASLARGHENFHNESLRKEIASQVNEDFSVQGRATQWIEFLNSLRTQV